MNPSRAWTMLSARSRGFTMRGTGGGDGMKWQDVADLLAGMKRGPFLTGLAYYAGDWSSVPDLERHLTVWVTDLHAAGNWRMPERGDWISRRLAAVAIYELLQPDLCEVCHGRKVAPKCRAVEVVARKPAEQRARFVAEERAPISVPALYPPPRHSTGYQCLGLAPLNTLPARPRRVLLDRARLRRWVKGREAKGERVYCIARHWVELRCSWCHGSGKSHMSQRIRAQLAGLPLSTWQRHWQRPYSSVYSLLDGWRRQANRELGDTLRWIREEETGTAA